MKLKTLLCSLALGLATLATQRASAFPLNLTALSGTITSTASYTNTMSNKVKVTAVTLKQVLTVVSNEISIRTSGTNAPPAKSRIALDPYLGQIYVTNNNGYYYNIGSFANVDIDEIATSFHQVGTNGGVEGDVLAIGLYIYGRGTDGYYYEFGVYGRGKLAYSVNGTTGRGSMILTATGTAYGEYKSSDDGVCTGAAVFSGSGTPEWEGPYSVFWWND